MRSFAARWVRAGGLALALTLSASSATAAVSPFHDAGHAPVAGDVRDVMVTERDVAESNREIESAYASLAQMWTDNFRQLGARFAVPSIARYRGAVRTSCGVMPANNALYCPSRNAIYFDEVFIARQAKRAAAELGTDGDMVAVGIIAHEVGHAVAMQLGEDSRIPYNNEATADCLAGAFTQHARDTGSLEDGDLEEAFFGMAAAGDPTPLRTGNARLDVRIAQRAQLMGHGTREQRMQNFEAGYEGGAGACLAAFR